jgi:hypothetical protein
MVDHQMWFSECKLVDRYYVFVVRETYHLKESGHKGSHNIGIVSPEEQAKVQGVMNYHHINIDRFYSQSNRKLRKDP